MAIPIIFFVIVLWAVIWFFKSPKRREELSALARIQFAPPEEKKHLPYRRRDYLLTVAERKFFEVLYSIAQSNHWHVFVKVRLEDLLWIPRYTPHLLKWRGYIRSRHIDFVICDQQNIRPLLAIELDDSSHERPDRIERDERVDKILQAAKLPIVHIRNQGNYDLKTLAATIASVIS